jgi:hypothetical protein
VRSERGPTRAVASRALSPPPTQPGAMPSDDGLGLDEDQRRPPLAPGGRQQDPKHAVTGAEVRPLHASLQGSQLVAEGKILEDHVVVATAGHGDRPQEQQCQCKHVLILSGVAAESNTGSLDDDILANDTPTKSCRSRVSALLSSKIVKHATLKVDSGAPDGLDSHAQGPSHSRSRSLLPTGTAKGGVIGTSGPELFATRGTFSSRGSRELVSC